MFVFCLQNGGQNHNLLILSKCGKLRYLGTTITNQNCIHEEIKNRLNFMQCLLPFYSESFILLSPLQLKFKICKTTILPVVSFEHHTRSLALREEYRLNVCENGILRRIT
jgi:hypothetical protein